MKEKIIELRTKGYTYSQIIEKLGCAKSTISYHLNSEVKEASIQRNKLRKQRKLDKGIYRFKKAITPRLNNFKASKSECDEGNFTAQDVLNKFTVNTHCYITGRKINLYDDKYNLDHIIPRCKGGTNNLDNLGITCPEANAAKGGLLFNDFLDLCKEILEFHGYEITKNTI